MYGRLTKLISELMEKFMTLVIQKSTAKDQIKTHSHINVITLNLSYPCLVKIYLCIKKKKKKKKKTGMKRFGEITFVCQCVLNITRANCLSSSS